ncbi:Salicylate O-methyltransferase [Acorus gramineus]|uniref:Salicylate O-methyltransferase n=1 Tax=Acorus gramineus TaxID=55184 RepID=A0AAV9BTP8_ACOGR|nr:Salicylate O-methyltransferase [Acorus gramineus]
MDFVDQKRRQLRRSSPEFHCFLNDLPGNDFNTVFSGLPELYEKLKAEKGADFGPCFIAGVPGSFYGRLFSRSSLHLVVSSTSLHWLSQVPVGLHSGTNAHLNKGRLYISKTSPPGVLRSYLEQFQLDFSAFLMSRSQEIIIGGCMVLTLIGRKSADSSSDECCFQWDLLANALMDMVHEDLIEEEKVDSLNIPLYCPSPEELMHVIEMEGSFAIDHLETIEVEYNTSDDNDDDNDGNDMRGQQVAKTFRVVTEPMLSEHFGSGEIMDDLFYRYGEYLQEYFTRNKGAKLISVLVSMVRKG